VPLTSEGEPYDPGDVPAGGLWISPEGEAISVVEHIAEIARDPERFGLAPGEVRGATIPQLLESAARMVKRGWIRFRLFSDVWAFEVDDLRARLRLIEEVLVVHGAMPQERVHVFQAKPKRDWSGTVGALFDRTIFRSYEVAGAKRDWRVT
jgi:hypothetical protein